MWMSTENPTTSVSYAIFSPFNRPHELGAEAWPARDLFNDAQPRAQLAIWAARDANRRQAIGGRRHP